MSIETDRKGRTLVLRMNRPEALMRSTSSR